MISWFDQAVAWAHEQLLFLFVCLFWPIYRFFTDGNTRYFWVYCATGLALTAFVYFRSTSARNTALNLFASETWLSTSARNDYYIVSLSAVLRATLLSWLILNADVVAGVVSSGIRWLGVSGEVNDSAALGLGIALTLTLFVVDDFNKFIAHYAMHQIPEFWEFHKVHHSAEVLNFATADRQHPFEVVLTGLVSGITIGVVNGFYIGFFGDTLTIATVAGANIFLFVFNVCGGVLRHSPVWLSFGPTIEKYFISPAMHHVHHSEDPAHFDKNMGGTLAIWDRLFGTLYIPNGPEVKKFGLGQETREFHSLSNIYFGPFVKSFEVAKRRLGIAH